MPTDEFSVVVEVMTTATVSVTSMESRIVTPTAGYAQFWAVTSERQTSILGDGVALVVIPQIWGHVMLCRKLCIPVTTHNTVERGNYCPMFADRAPVVH